MADALTNGELVFTAVATGDGTEGVVQRNGQMYVTLKKSHVDLAESVKSYIILQKNRLTELRLSVFFFHI